MRSSVGCIYAQYHYMNLIVCYNNAFRRLFGFEKYCSASGRMFANLTAASFGEIIIIFISYSKYTRCMTIQNIDKKNNAFAGL